MLHASTNYVTDAPILLEVVLERATYQILGDKLMRVEKGVPIELQGGVAPTVQAKAYWGGGHAGANRRFLRLRAQRKTARHRRQRRLSRPQPGEGHLRVFRTRGMGRFEYTLGAKFMIYEQTKAACLELIRWNGRMCVPCACW